ncbi:TetR/AcrR family transcriptional regulator [Rubrivivax sp. RP6-9]|uniref:TetR/AcrR family transcriptional regulator n=1 Tax=Rubrivivax sp. RP6-9 TaxID=3415750 RepID=UPI003CC64000
MPPLHAAVPAAGHLARKDGEDARQRLLRAGLVLFAQQGFAKTSTRELAEAAAVNVASISYYFGDKAGLYRAVFFAPMGDPAADVARCSDPALPLADALRGFYAAFLEPLRDGEGSRLCMKLRFREMLEPTGLWQEEMARGVQPLHDALVARLLREFELAAPDDDLLRLAVCLAGLGVHLHVGRDVTDQLAPGLHAQPDAIDRWSDCLTRFGLAMVDAEHQRRRAAAAARSPRPAHCTRRDAPTP